MVRLTAPSPSVSNTLDTRRAELGLSHAALAALSGVSLPTVHRALSGNHPDISFANLQAIAAALGLDFTLTPTATAEQLRAQQAARKADQLVRMLQATSALEGQAVDNQRLDQMRRQTARELLSGSNRKLWAP